MECPDCKGACYTDYCLTHMKEDCGLCGTEWNECRTCKGKGAVTKDYMWDEDLYSDGGVVTYRACAQCKQICHDVEYYKEFGQFLCLECAMQLGMLVSSVTSMGACKMPRNISMLKQVCHRVGQSLSKREVFDPAKFFGGEALKP